MTGKSGRRERGTDATHSAAPARITDGRLRLLLDGVKDLAVFMLDPDGRVSTWNAGAQRLKGYSAQEIVGKHFSCFYPRDDLAAGMDRHELEIAQRDGRYEEDTWRLRKDGSQFLAHVVITALRDSSGCLVGFANVTRDMTEQHRAREQFRVAIAAAPTGMLMMDSTGTIVLVNAQIEKLFGYPRNELLGKSIEVLVPERFRGRHPSFRKAFFGDPKARAMGAGRELYGLRRDGTEVPIEIGLNPIQTPEGAFVLSSVVDITERKRSVEQFRLAIEAAPTGMIMVERHGRVVLVNAQIEKLFGYRREELIGRAIEILVPERFRKRHPDFRADFFADPRSRPMGAGRDLYGLRKDGTEVPIEIGLNPLETPEGAFVLSSVVDITERKRAEQEREELLDQLEERVQVRTAELTATLKEREVLLQEVHHRVKNNLQVISSLISLQLRQDKEGASRHALEECQTRVQAIALIHQQLYQSKDYARVPFSEYTKSLAANVFQATGVSPQSVSLKLAVEDLALPVDKAIPCGLILNELITNALKHAFPAGREGTIRIELGKIQNGRLVLCVSDDGIGLPKGLDAQTAGSLGLQLVRMLAKQVDAELEIGTLGGTSFRLTIPVETLN